MFRSSVGFSIPNKWYQSSGWSKIGDSEWLELDDLKSEDGGYSLLQGFVCVD